MKLRLFMIALLTVYTISASIIKIPPSAKVEKDPTFQELVCTEDDAAKIHEIVVTVADNNKLSLLFKQTHLKELGAQINHVHPLKFLSTVFSDALLKTSMFFIWNDSWKKGSFLDGLAPSLTREAEKGKLHQYLPAFAEMVGAGKEQLLPYFDNKDWDGLVIYLIQS